MTCNELGGACDKEFQAETFEAMGELSREHAMEMFAAGDAGHLEAMDAMKARMQDPAAMQRWYEEKRQLFESLPDVD